MAGYESTIWSIAKRSAYGQPEMGCAHGLRMLVIMRNRRSGQEDRE
ncbi:MAG: hypothetical protein H7A45_09730 [Verrucomicrobiales bacterium]|nr:hypothetical protein [Verrucomicrobiales bacterium]MCP5526288.1 hypothetical protein [Verrucomicrobiales bacterium]